MVAKSKDLFGEENRACHMHAGQKLSKGLRKLFVQTGLSEIEDFEKLYAKLADALSPQVFERPFVLSINPIDYLTMSFGYGWTSCHTIDKTDIRGDDCHNYQGCYSSGTLSYMLDSTSIVMYTLSRESDLEEPEKNDKVQRQMCHYSPEAHKIIFGRIYPTSETDTRLYQEFRAIAQRVISECFDVTNLWNTIHGPSNCYDHTDSRGTHYEDYVRYDIGAVSKHQSLVRDLPVVIGHTPICPNCGHDHHVHETIICDDCARDTLYCAHCDQAVRRDHIEAYDGTIFCDDECANRHGYYWACDSEDYHYEDNLAYDDYEGEYFYHETVEVYVDGLTFISTENARAYGYEMDLDDNEWYSKDDMIQVCGDWFIDEENAIDYGYVRDAYTGELFWPSDGISDGVEESELWFANEANRDRYMEEHTEEVEA